MIKLICAVTLLAVSTAQAATIYVDVSCPGGNGSELDPYCSIQTAIDNAVDTDEIVVAPGTYFETIDFLGKAIWLHSSDGVEVTIIDGAGFFHVVQCVNGEGPDTVLDGFTITGGSADSNADFPDNSGGGMLNFLSSPTVRDCTFTDNSAGFGGGMLSFGDAVVVDCTFSGNSASTGGGMYNFQTSSTVTNCTFSENFALFSGGGMFNGLNGNSPTVTNCTFTGNSALKGGGMYNEDSSPTVTNCTFSGNTTDQDGGGMYNDGSSPMITDCTLSGNIAERYGGGMMIDSQGSSTVVNCSFVGNTAMDGGGLDVEPSDGNTTVTNCTFSMNTATGVGGGIYAWSPTVTNCTFSGNSGGGMYIHNTPVTNCVLWSNSPFEIDGDSAVVSYSNVQGGYRGIGNIDADPFFVDPDNGDLRLQPGSPCIDAADNTAVPVDIITDLDGNPRFLEIPETPDTGNGTLPIVDMGAYESLGGGCLAVMSQEVVCHADGTMFTVNIEGLNACTGGTTQVTFTASGGAVGEELCFTALVNDGGFCCTTEICVTIPDCTPAALPSDLDGDGIVGMVDFLALLSAWGSCSDCGTCPADFDGDCSVGIPDLLSLLANWTV